MTTTAAPPKCPDCGSDMVLRRTVKFTYRDGTARPFYGCSHYPDCMGTHGAHPDGRPLGVPGDAETKRARSRVHELFDRLWKPELGGTMRRDEAYAHLRWMLNLTADECHIGMFDLAACERAIHVLSAEVTPCV